jgi:hypothetical protein
MSRLYVSEAPTNRCRSTKDLIKFKSNFKTISIAHRQSNNKIQPSTLRATTTTGHKPVVVALMAVVPQMDMRSKVEAELTREDL